MKALEAWLTPRRLLWLAGIVGVAVVASVALMAALSQGMILPNKRVVGGDFLAFWSAGRLAIEGRLAEVHDNAALSEIHRRVAPAIGVVYLWHHPPTFLLAASGLAYLPYLGAIAVWLAFTVAVFALAARALHPDPRTLLFAFASPGAAMHLGNAQTGMLFAAVFAFSLVWLVRRPLAAGGMIGLFALKPHLAVLFPLALAADGRWRAFAGAAASALALCGAAYLAFGPGAFMAFLENLKNAENVVTTQRVAGQTHVSLYANLIGLGAPAWLAAGLHGLNALLAAVCVWRLWRRGAGDFAFAGLTAASMLISPYLFFYDLIVLLAACALLVRAVGWDGLSTWEKLIIVLAWTAPALSLTLGGVITLPLGPFVCWALVLIAARRSGVLTPS